MTAVLSADRSFSIRRVDPLDDAARFCLEIYDRELAERLDQGFDVTASRDPQPQKLRPPLGAFFVAFHDAEPVGCVALKGEGGEIAEIKRLWVASSARRLGLAQRLMAAAEVEAWTLGITGLWG